MAIQATLIAEPPPLYMNEAGVLRVKGTRVSLDSVIYAFKNGTVAECIVASYPTLTLSDVYAVIAYYLRHREEVEAYLEESRQKGEELRKEIETRWPSEGIRERLLARRKAQG